MNFFRALYHAAIKRKCPKTDLADKSLRPRIGLKNIFKPLLLSTTTSIRFQIRIEIVLVHNKLHSMNILSKSLPPGSSLVPQAEFWRDCPESWDVRVMSFLLGLEGIICRKLLWKEKDLSDISSQADGLTNAREMIFAPGEDTDLPIVPTSREKYWRIIPCIPGTLGGSRALKSENLFNEAKNPLNGWFGHETVADLAWRANSLI